MKHVLSNLLTICSVLMLSAGLGAQEASRQLRAAMNTEMVDGDLKGAVEQYKKVAAGKDRVVAAQALVRLAECYEKLGTQDARAVYQEIVSKYADQAPAVAIARAKLTGDPPSRSARPSQRAVWTGPYVDMFGQVSPDGRLITFVDWQRSMNLMTHDTVTGTDRALTDLPSFDTPTWRFSGQAEFSVISRDGTQVAYSWSNATGPAELRVMPLRGTSAESRVIVAGSREIQFFKPYDWSADGRWIAAALSRSDGTGQIALIDVATGALSVLRTVGWRGPTRIFFSPNSRFLAYDLPANDDTDQRDIFAMTVDHRREVPVVSHQANDLLVGWTPDGTRLLFTSDRAGADLWAQPWSGDGPVGVPEMVATDVRGISLGLTSAGAIYMFKGLNDIDVRRARFDLAANKVVGPPVSFDRGVLSGITVPNWSPDGKFLAYQEGEGEPEHAAIAIRTVATGDVRRLPGLYARDPRWSPDGRAFVVAARDRRGRNGIYKVDVATGATTVVVLGPGFGANPQWSKDGSKIFYKKGPGAIVERNLADDAERDVFAQPGIGIYEVSPDGRFLAVRTQTAAPNMSNLLLVPLGEGEPREIHAATSSGQRTIAWTPDSSAVMLLTRPKDSRAELWRVPLDGSTPRRVDFVGEAWSKPAPGVFDGGFGISADGQYIAFLSGTRSAEVWAIENFVPPSTR